jgi:hypothetical protein
MLKILSTAIVEGERILAECLAPTAVPERGDPDQV